MKNNHYTLKLKIVLLLFILFPFSLSVLAQTGPNDDFDGDGIINSIDIDDDNDGVLDNVECAPMPYFYYFNWQSSTVANTANIQPGERLISPNVFQINGQSYDAYFELISKNSGTGGATTNVTVALSGTNINLNSVVPSQQHYIIYEIFFVKNGDPVNNVVTFNELNFRINDLDNPTTPVNYTDVGAFITTPYTNFSYGSRLQNISPYGAVSNAYGLLTSLQGAGNDDPSSRNNANSIFAKFTQQAKYRNLHGVTGTYSSPVSNRGIVVGVQVLDKYCDSDGDGIPNHFDLDSDGDGCPDAVEAGTAAQAGSGNTSSGTVVNTSGTQTNVPNARVGSGGTTGYGANGFYNGIETSENGIYTGSYRYYYANNSNYNLCTDTDTDGIPNVFDIDDENDGVPDATESPACYYTLAESGVIAKVSTTMTSTVNGANVTSGNDIPTMRDGLSPNATATNHVIAAGQMSVLDAIIYQVEYPTAVNLASLSVVGGAASWGTSSAVVLEASDDGVSFITVSAPLATATTAAKTWTVIAPGTMNAYRYYRLRVSTAATSDVAINNYEVTAVRGSLAYIPSAHPKPTACADPNIDNDNIPPHLDLDTDGDGCSDALEAGATTDVTPNYQFTGPVGNNGLQNSLETSADSGTINYASTSNQYAINGSINACTDTDGDGVRDIIDIDDDNDGVLDIVECPNLFVSMTRNGGFSVPAANISNWYMGLASSALPIAEPFTSTVITISNTGNVSNYGIGGGNQVNSPLTGGLFDQYNGVNTATGLQYVLQENDPQRPVVSTLPNALVAGASYNFSFDLGNRASGSANKYIVMLYNADTQRPEKIIASDVLSSLPSVSSSPSYKTITGSFTPAQSGNYYLLFYPSVSGGAGDDFVIDRVAVVGAGTTACDDDNDGIPNHLDLDSDGDGCPDAVEAGTADFAGAGNTSAGTLVNTNGTQTNVPNAIVGNGTSNYGANGFYNGIENNDTSSAAYTGLYSYQYATDSNINACTDTDGDGVRDIFDIDDDNDGILDVYESNPCTIDDETPRSITWDIESEKTTVANLAYFTGKPQMVVSGSGATVAGGGGAWNLTGLNNNGTLADAMDKGDYQSSQFTTSNNYIYVDGFLYYSMSPLINVGVLIDDDPLFASPIIVNNPTGTPSNNGTVNNWQFMPVTNPSMLNPNTTYYVRFYDLTTATSIYHDLIGLSFKVRNGSNPCGGDIDTDNDGIPNRLDLDSDGDGCPDAVEAGTAEFAGAGNTSAGTLVNNSGTQTNVPNAIVGSGGTTGYGTNGFYNGIENNDTASASYTGFYNYFYAINSSYSLCTDNDGDGVGDFKDLDDDNDGVQDAVESPVCYFTAAEMGTPSLVISGIPYTQTIANLYDDNIATMFSFTSTAAANSLGKTIFEITPKLPQAANSIILNLNGANSPIGALSATATLKAQGWNGNNWIDLATYTTLPAINSMVQTFSFSNTLPYSKYRLFVGGSAGVAIGTSAIQEVKLGLPATYSPSANPKTNCNEDTDNDGIPNHLDLDSDGDGCPDTKEAILYNHFSESSIAGDVQNGSNGTVTSTVNTPNAMVPGPYGSNGFADALQLSTDPDSYKYIYSYRFVADNADISTCDNLFLNDIDIDDDGIPNAVESPSCFYTEVEAMNILDGVSSDFDWAAANPLSNTYDNDVTYGAVTPAVNIQNKALITVELPVIDPALIASLQLNVGATAFGGGTWRLEGQDINTTQWVPLSAAQAMSTANTNYTFVNTLQPNTRYHTYRIFGVTSTNITNNAQLIEVIIHYKDYNPSLHRTKMGCNSDGDMDGVPDYNDRDSDGDGCPDAVEAGIDKSLLVPSGFYNNGGIVNGDHVIVGGSYADNGMGNSVQTNGNGINNYVSTYALYANNPEVNFCLDTDGDSVPDPIDVDDDNDGVIDAVESPSCFYTITEANAILRITSQFASPDDDQLDRDIQILHNGDNVQVFNFNDYPAMENPTGSNLFTIEYPTQVRLGSLVVSHRISSTTNANAVVVASVDGLNWTAPLSPATAITTSPITFTITTADSYKFYKIQTGSTAGALSATNTIGEISSVIVGSYTPSRHPKPNCTEDLDVDLINNHLDLDSDGDGCPDAVEAGVSTNPGASGAMSESGGAIYSGGIASGTSNAYVGTGMPSQYGTNGFFDAIETAPGSNLYNGTYTYASAIDATLALCACYKDGATAGTILDTKHGITALNRAGSDANSWPTVRKGGWTALESKAKAFVPNRLVTSEISAIPAANLIEGMMVYNLDLDCIYINTDGTANGWKCFNTQTCP